MASKKIFPRWKWEAEKTYFSRTISVECDSVGMSIASPGPGARIPAEKR